MTTASLLANQVIETCESTNDLARQLAEQGYGHGTWISARTQARGRGRRGRSWISGEGNLFLSVLLDCPFSVRPRLPLSIALELHRSLVTRCPSLKLRVKWPNDLFVDDEKDGAKVGGILCETTRTGLVVAGIGINCATAPLTDRPTISLSQAGCASTGDSVRPVAIAAALHAGLLAEKAEDVSDRYNACAWLAPGAPVRWKLPDETLWNEGFVVGLGAMGELRVRTEAGAERLLTSEDVDLRSSR